MRALVSVIAVSSTFPCVLKLLRPHALKAHLSKSVGRSRLVSSALCTLVFVTSVVLWASANSPFVNDGLCGTNPLYTSIQGVGRVALSEIFANLLSRSIHEYFKL